MAFVEKGYFINNQILICFDTTIYDLKPQKKVSNHHLRLFPIFPSLPLCYQFITHKIMKTLHTLIIAFLILQHAYGQNNLQKSIETYQKEHAFSGIIAVTDKGKTVFEHAYGLANQEFGVKNTLDTRFKIASITKTFTAVLILQLIEQGKLQLTGKINEYLPDFKGEVGEKVSIENLLTYSSGREKKETCCESMKVFENKLSIDSFITQYCQGKIIEEPGTKFEYNNGDYVVLGKIIEKIYQKPWEQVLQEQILTPCGMKSTGVVHSSDIIPNLANGYYYENNKLIKDSPYYTETFSSSGAMYSTLNDMKLFDKALYNNVLLNKKTTEMMLVSHEDLAYVAFGFWTYPSKIGEKEVIFAERQGDILGCKAVWLRNLTEQKTIFILSNTIDGDINELKNLITNN